MHRVSGFEDLGWPSEDGSVTDWKQRDSRKVQVVLAPPPCFNDELSGNSHQSELTRLCFSCLSFNCVFFWWGGGGSCPLAICHVLVPNIR